MALHPLLGHCTGVIFDMNGVLVLDEPVHERAFREALARCGVVVSDDDFRTYCLGRPDAEGIATAAGRAGATLSVPEVVSAKRRRYWELVEAGSVPAVADSVRLAQELLQAGIRLALATASPADEAEAWIARLGLTEAFSPVLHRGNCAVPKPSPQVYLTILGAWNMPPSVCVVLDDHPANIAIAHALGMRTIAVTSAFAHQEFGGADDSVASLAELFREE